jgi:hypothetical protein
MFTFPGYHPQQKIYKSYNSVIYRGIQNSDDKKVVIKMLNEKFPTFKQIVRFNREYEIINAHNGKIWAENNSEGGATFSFMLPYEQENG